jgi:hypothetical protein
MKMNGFFETAVPCMGFMGFFVLIFGTVALFRWFRHREILKLAEKGLLPEQYAKYISASHSQNRGSLGWGIALVAVGLALMAGLWPIGFVYGRYPLGFGPWMLVGLIPLFIGLALLITYVLVRKEEASEASVPEIPLEEKAEFLDD